MRRDLCDSAKRGKVCIDSLCRGMDITLCGFDKEAYEEMLAEETDLSQEDDDFDLWLDGM